MSAIVYHYDGSPCFESCPCASREVERLRAQLAAVTREMVEAREFEARMRVALNKALEAIERAQHRGPLDGLEMEAVRLGRAALAAPAPEPSERMMRVAEAVRSEASDKVRDADDWVPLNCLADAIDALDLRAIVAKVTP